MNAPSRDASEAQPPPTERRDRAGAQPSFNSLVSRSASPPSRGERHGEILPRTPHDAAVARVARRSAGGRAADRGLEPECRHGPQRSAAPIARGMAARRPAARAGTGDAGRDRAPAGRAQCTARCSTRWLRDRLGSHHCTARASAGAAGAGSAGRDRPLCRPVTAGLRSPGSLWPRTHMGAARRGCAPLWWRAEIWRPRIRRPRLWRARLWHAHWQTLG
jgi:hypothetical protein